MIDRRELLATACLSLLTAPAWAQSTDLAIDPAKGIDEGAYLDINGVQQWVRIRGQDRSNPVVLHVHGGPGGGMSATGWPVFAHLGWEKHFTVVTWDQQGAGRTWIRSGKRIPAGLTLAQIDRDGVKVAELVAKRMNKKKIILVGGSWGSHIAVRMTKLRPDLFSAYVGAAQAVKTRADEGLAYDRVLGKARALGDATAIRELEAAGRPPYPSMNEFIVQRKWASAFERPAATIFPPAPDATPEDIENQRASFLATDTYFRGMDMKGPIRDVDLYATGRDFPMPVFLFHGEDDYITPAARVEAWVNWLRAPKKKLVLIEGGGHNIMFRSGRFLDLMVQYVSPLAV